MSFNEDAIHSIARNIAEILVTLATVRANAAGAAYTAPAKEATGWENVAGAAYAAPAKEATKPKTRVKAAKAAVADDDELPEEEIAEVKTKPEPAEDITIDTLRRAFANKARKNTPALTKLLARYRAKTIPELPEDSYPEILAEVEAMEG